MQLAFGLFYWEITSKYRLLVKTSFFSLSGNGFPKKMKYSQKISNQISRKRAKLEL